MKLKNGTLYLIKSKNPPVFKTPMAIQYSRAPKVGQAFLFDNGGWGGMCNLSIVKHIRRVQGVLLIETLNSVYVLDKEGHHVTSPNLYQLHRSIGH